MIPLEQFDNFASDAAVVRNAVIAGGFASEKGPDGAIYTGISQYRVDHWFARIAELTGVRIIPRLSCFRLNLAGELPHSWVHSDDICAKYASVLYLNQPEQCQGGTAFWKHKAMDVDHLASDEVLAACGVDYVAYHRMMTAEWKRLEAWEQTNFVSMQWNRFITYPTRFFHSRYPFKAFGKGPEDGRLIWICFYDREGK